MKDQLRTVKQRVTAVREDPVMAKMLAAAWQEGAQAAFDAEATGAFKNATAVFRTNPYRAFFRTNPYRRRPRKIKVQP